MSIAYIVPYYKHPDGNDRFIVVYDRKGGPPESTYFHRLVGGGEVSNDFFPNDYYLDILKKELGLSVGDIDRFKTIGFLTANHLCSEDRVCVAKIKLTKAEYNAIYNRCHQDAEPNDDTDFAVFSIRKDDFTSSRFIFDWVTCGILSTL